MYDRADRLGATMLLLGIVREPAEAAVQRAAEFPCLTPDEWEAWRETDDEDFRLAHACLNAEFEHRARQFDALERFGTAYAAGTGDSYAERVASMPAEEARASLLAAVDLGWHHTIGGKPDDGR